MPPSPREPRYRQIADELRRRISAGAIPSGAPLPSEPAIAAEFGVSVPTVRQAMALLRLEGLVFTEQGRASFVRAHLPVRRLASDRYRADADQINSDLPPETSFTRDQGIAWADYRLDKDFAEAPADAHLAALLDVPLDTPLLRRRFVFYAHGYPQQMSYSYYPLDLVAGTPVADPANEPWPGGNIAQLHTLGITVTSVREEIRARMPTQDEIVLLKIPDGVPVVAITRRMFADEQPVEVAADIVIPADRVVLDYQIDL